MSAIDDDKKASPIFACKTNILGKILSFLTVQSLVNFDVATTNKTYRKILLDTLSDEDVEVIPALQSFTFSSRSILWMATRCITGAHYRELKIQEEKRKKVSEDKKMSWQPDSDVSHCNTSHCNRKFGYFFRKHHCRNCGLVYCDSCTSTRVKIGEMLQRICRKCLETTSSYQEKDHSRRIRRTSIIELKQQEECTIDHFDSTTDDNNEDEVIEKMIVEQSESVVHWASRNGFELILEHLLKSNRDVYLNLLNQEGKSPLIVACEFGRKSCIDLLINQKADLDIIDDIGVHALFYLCDPHEDMPVLVKKIVMAGANVDIVNRLNGESAIHRSCDSSLLEITKTLVIDGKCDISIPCMFGNTPLHYAVGSGNLQICELLLGSFETSNERKLLNLTNNEGLTPFFQALQNGHLHLASVLILKGADINMKDANYWSPLYWASFKGDVSVVDLLLNTIITKSDDEDTVLLVDEADLDGNTPLFIACSRGNQEIAASLIIKGNANMNLKSQVDGATALFRCTEFGMVDGVSMLVSLGADINISNDDNMTPLQCAQECEANDIIKILQNRE